MSNLDTRPEVQRNANPEHALQSLKKHLEKSFEVLRGKKRCAVLFSGGVDSALAALMSTADSQLLSLSTMLSRDLPFNKKRFSEITIGKILVVVLTLFGIIYVVSGYNPNDGIQAK